MWYTNSLGRLTTRLNKKNDFISEADKNKRMVLELLSYVLSGFYLKTAEDRKILQSLQTGVIF